jgi:histidine ammonia-lyase
VERAVPEGRTVYGVTTGFGALATTRVPPDEAAHVQYALVQSHAAASGPTSTAKRYGRCSS